MSSSQSRPSIFDDETALESTYREDLFVQSDQKLLSVANRIEPVLNKQPPTNLFITGEPGTGKTATTHHALKILKEEMECVDRTFHAVHVTAVRDRGSYRTLIEVINGLRSDRGEPELPAREYSDMELFQRLQTELAMRSGILYIVIDKVDEINNPNKILKDLASLDVGDAISSLDVGIIAIANDARQIDGFPPSAESGGQSAQISFPRYSPDEVEQILRTRSEAAFNEDVISDSVISYVTSRTHQRNSDVRYGLNLLQEAGHIANRRLREELKAQESASLEIRDIEEAMAP